MSVLNRFKTELFDPAFPLLFHTNPAPRVSVLAIPNIIVVPNPAFVLIFAKKFILPGSNQIPSPVIVSGIQRCILAKCQIPEISSYSLYHFLLG